jgi:hypothetical protein
MKTRHALAVSTALALLLSAGCSASPSNDTPANLVRDKKALALNLDRLAVAVDDINSIDDPPYTRTKKQAASYGCSMDSGDVFEPEVNQVWTLTGPARDNTDPTSVDAKPLRATPLAQQAMNRIAAQLVSRGWSGKPRVQHTKEDIYVIDLHRNYRDHRIDLGMQGFSDSIILTATTTPKHVCSHRP